MRDASGQLTKRGQLLRLHQTILRGAQILQRGGQLARARLDAFKQAYILDRDRRLVGEGATSSICLSVNGRTARRQAQHPMLFHPAILER